MGRPSEGRSLTEPDYSASGPFGGFGPEDLLACYARGVFPMAESRDDPRIFIIEPEQRGVIPLDEINAGFDRLHAGEVVRLIVRP